MTEQTQKLHPCLSEAAILFPVLVLVGLGIIMVYSASSAIGLAKYNDNFYFMQRQALFSVVSLGIMFTASMVPYQVFRPFSYGILILSMASLCAVHVPSLGVKAGGAYRWLRLGGFTFQPAEVAKFAMIIFMAYSLTKKQDKIDDFYVGFVPHVIVLSLLSLMIIIQPDLGTVVILGSITWAMMYIAGVRISHLLSLFPIAVLLAYFFVYKVGYRWDRWISFLHPWDDPLDKGYQITHSLKAFGSGGVFGQGIGLGMQKLHYLPEPHTDFIFSVIGEELGLVGVLFVLLLYSIILWRGAAIARQTNNLFGALIAAGLTVSLGIQVVINTGVTLGLLPTKGLTLPFLSYGGTSLVINMACMGILMNIGASENNG
ncbi:MAG: putative lipid II flippase FtsW [Pseudomonadota bacterium]